MSDCDINIHNFNMIGPSGSSRAQRVQAVNFKCNPPVTENITCEFIPDGTAGSGSNACYTVGSAPAGWYGQWPLQCVTSPGQTSCSMSVSGFRNSVLNFQTSCNSANPPYTSVYTLGSASATGSRVLPQWTVPLFCGDRICTENQSIFDNVKGTWFVCKNGAWADCGVMGICS